MSATVIAIANQKGGVGKTTTTINLGAALAATGRRTLLIDFDPQANLTVGLGMDVAAVEHSTANLLLDGGDLRQAIRPTAIPDLDIVPSTIELAHTELQLNTAIGRERALRDLLGDRVQDGYRYILIDAPPTLGLLTVNALVACDYVLVPVQTHFYALKGLTHLFILVNTVKAKVNPGIAVLGLLATFHDGRTNLGRDMLDTLREAYPEYLLETVIRTATRVAEASLAGQPVRLYARSSESARAYESLADEVIKRVEG